MTSRTPDEPTPVPDQCRGLAPFMRSQRPERAGRPDTEFYWLTIDGKACIGKSMTMTLGPQVADLLDNERQVLRLLMQTKAPVCRLVDSPGYPDWLVTEFAGLSLHLLSDVDRARWPALAIQERVSVWAHFLRKAQALADLGAVPIDLAERNLVVPVGSNGQLQLNAAVSIDHAHTLLPSAHLPSGELRRPVWIDAKRSTHLAPEIRACLQRDLEKFLIHLNAVGAAVPGTTAAVMDPNQLSAKTWLAYDEPQDVQLGINGGSIDANKAIQYAVGDAIHRRLKENSEFTSRIAPVVRRLCAKEPKDRFAKLEEAADALKLALGGQVALASLHFYHPSLPDDLIAQSEPAREPISLENYEIAGSEPAGDGKNGDTAGGTMYFDDFSQPEPEGARTAHPNQAQSASPAAASASTPHSASGQRASGAPDLPVSLGASWHWYAAAVVLALGTGIPLGLWLASP